MSEQENIIEGNSESSEQTETQTQESLSEQENTDLVSVLEKEKQELKEAYLRLSAETDNYRKRIQKEKEEFQKYAVRGLIENLLPVVDNLERSLKAADASDNMESLKQGISMVLAQFEDVLKNTGLEKIEIQVGDEFDPQVSEALMIEETDDGEYPMTVTEVFETGRTLGGVVLRSAKVKVAKKKQQ